MPNWKKLIVSGSDANLNSLDIATELTASDALITNDLDVLGKVGIGTTSPLAKLHVKDGNVLSSALGNTSALIEGFNQSILQIASHSTGYSQIAFGDQDDGFDGGFIYSNASRFLSIETANAERMRITSAGNVGIGTTSPSFKLDVNGTSRFSDQVSINDPNGNAFKGNSNLAITSTLADVPQIRLIGKLQAVSTGQLIGGLEFFGQDTSSGSKGLAADIKAIADSNWNSSTTPGVLTFSTNPPNVGTSGLVERMRIDSAGNVGIGTASPSGKLTVDNTNTVLLDLKRAGNLKARFIADSNHGQFDIYNSAQVQSVRLIASGNSYFNGGNVGIGTTSPTEALQVTGNVSASGDFIGTNFTGSSFTGSFVGDGSGLTDTPININAGTALTFSGNTLNVSTAGTTLSSANIPSSAAFRTYAIENQSNAAQNLVVNVPWTDNNTTYTAGTGLSLSVGNVFSANTSGVPVIVGSSIPATVSNRYYAIQTNIGDELIVNVPWTDTSWDGIFSGSAQITGSLGVTGSYDQEANTTSAAATIKNTNINGRGLDIWAANGGAGNNTILRLGTSSETVKMVVIENGNVGIGTTNPAQKLHISDSNARIRIQDSDGTNQYFELRQSGGDSIFTSRDNTNNGEFQFKLFDGTTTTTALRIFSTLNSTFAGSITATTMTLSSTTDQILNLDSTDNGAVYTALKRSNSRIGYVGFGGSGSTLTFANELSGTVSISNPAGSLAINPNGSATFTGNVTAPTFLGDLSGSINTLTTAVTKPDATNDTTVATTAFVQSLIGTIPAGLVFQGTWNAATNTPTLASGTGTTGHFYIVSVDGSTNLDGITDWKVGDWAVFVEQGATDAWEKVDNSSVLDGSGTGNQITKWAGSGTSNTLTNSIITDNGTNVGIGITPTEKLEVNGGIKLADNSFLTWSTSNTRIVGQSGYMQLQVAGADTMRLTSAGNVGIGTTSPDGSLEIYNISSTSDGDGSATETLSGQDSLLLQAPTGAAGETNGSITWRNGNRRRAMITSVSETTDGDIKGIAFYTRGTDGPGDFFESMRIAHSGNVGIGTTNPGAKLDVDGDVLIKSGEYISWGTVGATSIEGSTASNKLQFRTNSADRMIIDSSGNVGIGDTSPGRQLTLGGAAPVLSLHSTSLTGESSIYFGDTADDNEGRIVYSNSQDAMQIWTAASEAVRVTSAGNVGIGTTNPNAALSVHNTTSTLGSRVASFYHTNGSNNPFIEINSLSDGMQLKSGFSTGVAGHFDILTSGGSSFITLSANSTEAVRVTAPGNVGIGTTNPRTKLEIGGTGNLGAVTNKVVSTIIDGGFSTTNQLQYNTQALIGTSIGSLTDIFANTGSETKKNFYVGIISDNSFYNNPRWSVVNNGAERLVVDQPTGNVGIGTTNPTEALQVTGNVSASGDFIGTNFTGSSFTGSFVGDGSGLTGVLVNSGSWDGVFSGSAQITGSLGVTGSVLVDGNIGIGTTSPNAKLDVESGATSDIARFKNDNGSIVFGYASTQASIDLPASNTFRIRQGSETPLRIISNGNVGIGTTSPAFKLDTISDSVSVARFKSNGTKAIIYLSEADEGGLISTEANRLCFGSGAGISSTNVNYHMGTERLGIGTASPTEKLDVIGNIKASGSIQVGVNEGNPTAALVGSIRYKSDANNSFVDMVMQTDVTTYEWVNIVTNTW